MLATWTWTVRSLITRAGRDLAIAQATRDEARHLALTRRQRGERR